MQEIERKFLVIGDFKSLSHHSSEIAQGYISASKEKSVRIRMSDEKAFITIKGASNASGTTRFEWEKEISISEAKELMLLCEPGAIDKTRYLVKSGAHTFEIDEFHGENEGLVIAEVELSSENEPFDRPAFLGNEVTGINRYYNAMLMQHPYKSWE